MERLQLIQLFEAHGQIRLHVTPNAKVTEIISIDSDSNTVSMRIQAVPDKGKANKGILQYFKKELKLNIDIVKGHKSRDKIIVLRSS